jgi:hypothetical protein
MAVVGGLRSHLAAWQSISVLQKPGFRGWDSPQPLKYSGPRVLRPRCMARAVNKLSQSNFTKLLPQAVELGRKSVLKKKVSSH